MSRRSHGPVVVPLAPRHGWDACLDFSRALAEDLVRAHPSDITPKMRRELGRSSSR